MKDTEKDKMLKDLMKDFELESPGKGFSTKVMNRIFELNSYIQSLKSERIFGKGFWIILSLFVLILAAILFAQGVYGLNGGESQINNILSDTVNTQGLSEGYESVYEKVTNLPLSIAGILLASSLLLIVERFLNSRSKLRS